MLLKQNSKCGSKLQTSKRERTATDRNRMVWLSVFEPCRSRLGKRSSSCKSLAHRVERWQLEVKWSTCFLPRDCPRVRCSLVGDYSRGCVRVQFVSSSCSVLVRE